MSRESPEALPHDPVATVIRPPDTVIVTVTTSYRFAAAPVPVKVPFFRPFVAGVGWPGGGVGLPPVGPGPGAPELPLGPGAGALLAAPEPPGAGGAEPASLDGPPPAASSAAAFGSAGGVPSFAPTMRAVPATVPMMARTLRRMD
jgi:hypothetical protein